MTGPFLNQLVDVLVRDMGAAYPELPASRDTIVQVVRNEEERFDAVLNDGLPRLESVLAAAGSGGMLPGREIFRLYDTYGLPLDFIADLAGERAVAVDRAGFEQALESQRHQSRATASFGAKDTPEFRFVSDEDRARVLAVPDRFEGYTTTRVDATRVLALYDDTRAAVVELDTTARGYVVLDRTPFYIESGGQVSDTGWITVGDDAGVAEIDGVARLAPGSPRVHHVRVTQGRLRTGDAVTAEVDRERRDAIRRNHTATHLLHAVLREQLGTHVKQAGSLVAPDRLRFDFAHGAPIGRDELDAIERRVNAYIYANAPVDTEVRSTQDAIDAGATALFGEKYGESVRVVSVPGVSMELCGGTHCRATGDIGSFAIHPGNRGRGGCTSG